MVNGPTYLGVNGTVRDYEEWKFGQFALAVIQKHNASDAEHPLFLNYNMHIAHEPLQAPHPYFRAQEVLTNATFPDAPGQPRAIYHAMVHFADDVLGNLTAALVANGDMWKNTLVVLTSDNGGGSMWAARGVVGGAHNWPARVEQLYAGGADQIVCFSRADGGGEQLATEGAQNDGGRAVSAVLYPQDCMRLASGCRLRGMIGRHAWGFVNVAQPISGECTSHHPAEFTAGCIRLPCRCAPHRRTGRAGCA